VTERSSDATLFGRTARAFTLAFLLFSVFSLGLVVAFVTLPSTQRGARDLSSLIVLTAQIWVELPPGTRHDFEHEMRTHHDIIIGLSQGTLREETEPAFYLVDFLQALKTRTGKWHRLYIDPAMPQWRWVDIEMGRRTLRVGFDRERFRMRIPLTLILMVIGGTLIAVSTSLLIVKRVTQPIAALAQASTRIGEGRRGPPLEEQGARELQDLTRAFNQMERRLHVLMDNRTVLLAGISHDLRTPIARMQLELELLSDTVDEDLRGGMLEDLAEMNEIIATTLELSHGVSNEACEKVELCELLKSVQAEFQRQGETVILESCQPVYRVLPVVAFRRVLRNLLENGIRYSDGQPVRVLCNTEPDGVSLCVIDKGSGIPESQREIILQPFKRLEESRNKASGGSGLGLAIVDQLCRMNNWRLRFEDAEGGGTRVRLTLP
jgi:two-component system, OmpR family, osmolarity sensor histidine kinase EnvZ